MNQEIPSGIVQYETPAAAMAAFKTATGGSRDRTFFLRHMVVNDAEWLCAVDNGASYCYSDL